MYIEINLYQHCNSNLNLIDYRLRWLLEQLDQGDIQTDSLLNSLQFTIQYAATVLENVFIREKKYVDFFIFFKIKICLL